ncbi:unnamed protein product [Pedinophyceae sp. YPF-701]|nr:unnamed protein product [Pedinophyceae sp. YPF-701]
MTSRASAPSLSSHSVAEGPWRPARAPPFDPFEYVPHERGYRTYWGFSLGVAYLTFIALFIGYGLYRFATDPMQASESTSSVSDYAYHPRTSMESNVAFAATIVGPIDLLPPGTIYLVAKQQYLEIAMDGGDRPSVNTVEIDLPLAPAEIVNSDGAVIRVMRIVPACADPTKDQVPELVALPFELGDGEKPMSIYRLPGAVPCDSNVAQFPHMQGTLFASRSFAQVAIEARVNWTKIADAPPQLRALVYSCFVVGLMRSEQVPTNAITWNTDLEDLRAQRVGFLTSQSKPLFVNEVAVSVRRTTVIKESFIFSFLPVISSENLAWDRADVELLSVSQPQGDLLARYLFRLDGSFVEVRLVPVKDLWTLLGDIGGIVGLLFVLFSQPGKLVNFLLLRRDVSARLQRAGGVEADVKQAASSRASTASVRDADVVRMSVETQQVEVAKRAVQFAAADRVHEDGVDPREGLPDRGSRPRVTPRSSTRTPIR